MKQTFFQESNKVIAAILFGQSRILYFIFEMAIAQDTALQKQTMNSS